jgi:CheY-like chemotaxis protein
LSAHVLVVDDSVVIHEAATRALSGPERCSVTGVRSPSAALAEARRQKPDLILVDLSLGGMGGLALCESIAQDAVLRDVPVVLMTAAHDPLLAPLKNVVAPIALLMKPFSPDAIRRSVRDNLDDQRLALRTQEDQRLTLQRWAEAISAAPDPDTRLRELENCLTHYGVGPDVAMSGELATIALAELFQMLTLQSQTGVLHVETTLLSLDIFFWEGKIDFVQALRATPALLLGRVLVAEGAMRAKELELFLRYRRPHKLLGSQLVQLGLVQVEELRLALARQSSELIYELLRQRSGRFTFRQVQVPPLYAQEFRLALSTDALLMEGYRRVDELQLIEQRIGSRQNVFACDPHAVERFGHSNLTPEEQQVLALCDGVRSVSQIVDRAPLGPFDALKSLYRLLEARLIAPVSLEVRDA